MIVIVVYLQCTTTHSLLILLQYVLLAQGLDVNDVGYGLVLQVAGGSPVQLVEHVCRVLLLQFTEVYAYFCYIVLIRVA